MIRALAAGALVTLVAGSAGWKPAAPLPLARSEVAAAAYGTGIVVVGGYLAGGTGKNTARADLYLPRQYRWRRLPDYPLPIDHAAAVGAGRRAYVVGGFANRGDQVRVGYSLENGRWRRLPTLPAARAASGAALIGSKLYVVGGFAGEKLAQSMLVLDLSTRRWSSAPGPTRATTSASPRWPAGSTRSAVRRTSRDESSRSSSRGRPASAGGRVCLRSRRLAAASGVAATGGAVIAAGGTNQRRPFATVQRLKPGAFTWTSLPSLRTARHSLGLVPMGGRLYAIGGGQYALSVSSANEFLSLR